jgi:hypothetical protein
VGAGVVTAATFNFHRAMVAKAVPSCWEVVAPDDICVVRAKAATGALRDSCTPESLDGLVDALPLLRRAAGAASDEGRILSAANRRLWSTLAVPLAGQGLDDQGLGLAEAWQACTTLREHRGDGHVAALVAHGLSGLGAHLLVSGVTGVPREILRDNRGWSELEWDQEMAPMVERGLLGSDGSATEAGRDLLHSVEDLTDALAQPAYAGLTDDGVDHLYGSLLAAAAQTQATLLPFPNPMGLPPLPTGDPARPPTS